MLLTPVGRKGKNILGSSSNNDPLKIKPFSNPRYLNRKVGHLDILNQHIEIEFQILTET